MRTPAGLGLRWGVESICEQLTAMGCKIAPATYYEHRSRTPSRQELRDAELKPKITVAHAANYGVFGARKIWLTLNRERPAGAAPIARCTAGRLMGELGLAGAVRGKVRRTTISDPKAARPRDLVNRNFRPLAPDRLWVADFTYVPTWSGWCYTAFVIDACARRILGWSVATTMTSQLVIDAVPVRGLRRAPRRRRDQAIDRGRRLIPLDNALAESVNGLFKTELIKPCRPWKGSGDLEIATAEWVDWFNHHRPFEYCDEHPSRPSRPTTLK